MSPPELGAKKLRCSNCAQVLSLNELHEIRDAGYGTVLWNHICRACKENQVKKVNVSRQTPIEINRESDKSKVLTGDKPDSLYENQLLDYKQSARYLSLSESYLRRLKKQGKVPYVLFGSRGVRFRVAALNRWIREREVQ